MKVAIIHTNLTGKGGLERVVLAIAERYDADIFTLEYSPEKTFEGFKNVNVEVLGGPKPHGKISLGLLSALRFSTLKLDGYDVVNPHRSPSELCALRNDNVLWYCHSPNREAFDLYEFRQSERGIEKYPLALGFALFRHLDRFAVGRIKKIAVNSVATKEKLRRYLGRGDGEVIYPFVDADEFYVKEYGRFFFYPSRIVPEKRFEMAIEAFKRAKLKGFKLVIAGFLDESSERDVNYLSRLKDLSRGLNIEFVISPSEEQLKELYASCLAVLFTPINEDFGIVPLEGMASKKPVLAVDEGGPRETVVDGKTGFLIKTTDELAERMAFLADNPGVAESLGKEGRKRVEMLFSREAFFSKFDALAREVSKL